MNEKKSSLKKRKSRKGFLIFLEIIIFLALASYVGSFAIPWAQTQVASQALEVSPPSQEIESDPGKVLVIRAKLTNKSNNVLPIKVRIEDFTASGDEGQIALVNNKDSYSVTSWTKITPDSFTLRPGNTQEVTATLNVPALAAGGRYGSFVFAVQGDQKPGSATVTQEIASLFLLKVQGPVTENLLMTNFTAPKFSEFGPVQFAMKFTNTGNIHVKTYGLVNISDMFGKKVDDVIVKGTNIFPGANRVLTTNLNQKFLFGKYTATAVMYFGTTSNHTLTATTTFIVFPLRVFAAVIIALLLLFAIRKRLIKSAKALFG